MSVRECLECGAFERVNDDEICSAHENAGHNMQSRPVKVPHPHVDTEPEDGSLVRGTKVAVRRLWSWHVRGIPCATLFKRYPQIGPSQILDALSFAYDNTNLIEAELARDRARK